MAKKKLGKQSRLGNLIGRTYGKAKSALRNRKIGNEGTSAMRARIKRDAALGSGLKKRKRALKRASAYRAASKRTGMSVASIGRNTSARNIGRRVAFKFTAARKAALKKAQAASAAVRRRKKSRGTAPSGGQVR